MRDPPSFCVIIPARMSSSRLPGKPLADIHGRPMLAWVHDCAQACGSNRVVIATEDETVRSVAESFGACAVLTSDQHQSGTDRLAEVVDHLAISDDMIVVNLQGDEPLMIPALLKQVARLLEDHPEAGLSTLMVPVTDPDEFHDPSVVKVVVNDAGEALYFSRSPIPYDRDGRSSAGAVLGYRHLGLYAYRAGFLRRFIRTPMGSLETLEKLEQLRALAMGERVVVAVAETAPPAGVDTPADLDRVRRALMGRSGEVIS